jgi:hypothetical protein
MMIRYDDDAMGYGSPLKKKIMGGGGGGVAAQGGPNGMNPPSLPPEIAGGPYGPPHLNPDQQGPATDEGPARGGGGPMPIPTGGPNWRSPMGGGEEQQGGGGGPMPRGRAALQERLGQNNWIQQQLGNRYNIFNRLRRGGDIRSYFMNMMQDPQGGWAQNFRQMSLQPGPLPPTGQPMAPAGAPPAQNPQDYNQLPWQMPWQRNNPYSS